MKPFSFLLFVTLLSFSFNHDSIGQIYGQNPDFKVLNTYRTNDSFTSFIEQPDKKILVAGSFDFVNGITKGSLVRLNEDGSPDDNFNSSFSIDHSSIALRPDGNIVSKSFSGSHIIIYLINTEGQEVATYETAVESGNIISRSIAVQSDNKTVFGSMTYDENFVYKASINRIDIEGNPDETFIPSGFTSEWIQDIYVQSDDKLLLTGRFTLENGEDKTLIRLNKDGSIDSDFNPAIEDFIDINTVCLQDDGEILIGTYYGLDRLNADGSYDPSFSSTDINTQRIDLQSDGKIVAVHQIKDDLESSDRHVEIRRYNADGTRDMTFDAGEGAPNAFIGDLLVQQNNDILAGGFRNFSGNSVHGMVRLNGQDGSTELSFTTNFEDRGHIENAVTQLDGKILVYGDFERANDSEYFDLVRLEADGSVDETFNIGTGVDNTPDISGDHFLNVVWVQNDKKILAGGRFSSFNGESSNSLVRLNENGTIDRTFNDEKLSNYYITTIAVNSKEDIFTSGINRSSSEENYVLKFSAAGTIDNDFGGGKSFNNLVNSIIVQSDDKLLVAGTFEKYGEEPVAPIVRLTANGDLDSSFQPDQDIDAIQSIQLLPNGKVLLLTVMATVSGNLTNTILQLNEDGTVDNSFHPDLGSFYQIESMLRLDDGTIILTGYFDNYKNLLVLNSDGSIDDTFEILTYGISGLQEIRPSENGLILMTGSQLYKFDYQKITNINDQAEGIGVYPNPATSHVNVEVPNKAKLSSIVLFNSQGRQINAPVTKNANISTIETSGLPTGIYFLHVTVDENRNCYKIVVN